MGSMFNLGWIPIIFVLSTILGYFIPYFIATYTGHVYPFFPAISDSGIMEPESLVFREMMNISGFLAMTTTFIRYLQLQLVISSIHSRIPAHVQQLSFTAMIIGEIGGFAVTFVGNFSAKKDHAFAPVSEYSVHNVAAVIVFSSGLLYCAVQSAISFKIRRFGVNSKRVCYLRFGITISVIFNFTIFVAFSRWANHKYDILHEGHDHIRKLGWRPGQDGYIQHLISSISEWFMCLSLVFYSLTFVQEFNFVRITTDFSEEYTIEDLINTNGSGTWHQSVNVSRRSDDLTSPES